MSSTRRAKTTGAAPNPRDVQRIVERRLAAWAFLHGPTPRQVEAKREELTRGIEAERNERPAIEVSVRPGIPTLIIVGVPDAYTARVRETLRRRDKMFFPTGRTIVNITTPTLAPHAVVADAIEAHGEDLDEPKAGAR